MKKPFKLALSLPILLTLATTVLAIREPAKPLKDRVSAAETVFLGKLVNRVEEGEWVRAELLVEKPLRKAEKGAKVEVIWRKTLGNLLIYDAAEGDRGIAILKDKHKGRYWLRADKFEKPDKLAEVKKRLIQAAGENDVVAIVKTHLRAVLTADQKRLRETYAEKVQLTPGHEFLKDRYGIAEPGARAKGAVVESEKLIAAIVKATANRKPRPAEQVEQLLQMLTFKTSTLEKGTLKAEPTDPVGTADGKLHLTAEKGDVLVKAIHSSNEFLLIHLRQGKSKWKVVSEYID